MGLFDTIKDQALGFLGQKSPAAATMIKGLIDQNGGIDGIVKSFQEKGFGEAAKSWVATGANSPITAEAIQKVFGNEKVKELAAKIGVTPETVSAQIATHLPQIIDKLTPNGKIG